MRKVTFWLSVFLIVNLISQASAQSTPAVELAPAVAIGYMSSTSQRILRIEDKEKHVVCYVLSDGKTSLSCVNLK